VRRKRTQGIGPGSPELEPFVGFYVFRCAGPFKTCQKGTGRKTSVVSRVSMMPMFPRVSMVPEGYSAAAMVLCFGGDHGAQ